MPSPYAMDLRTRVLAACDRGRGAAAVAAKDTGSPAGVYRLLQRRRQTGETQPRKGRPGPPPRRAGQSDRLRQLAQAAPDLTAQEYRDRRGACCAVVTAWRALRRLGRTFQKKCPAPRSSGGPTWRPSGSGGGPR